MKENIHPDYHEIKIVMTDGTEFTTRSCWGKPGETMRLDIDPKNHPAWQGGTGKVVEKGALSKFEKRFSNFGLSGGAGVEKASDAKPAAKADAKKDGKK